MNTDSKFHFICDYQTKKVIRDCNLKPTEVKKEVQPWLYAYNVNTGFDDDDDDDEGDYTTTTKVGKWMLFVSPEYVNSVWQKIKNAIEDGHLWNSKVSTIEPSNKSHAIMIYTKDYTDLPDVIKVLDYLETSGIKSANSVIKYKTDRQTYAGVYAGGKQRPWIYSSDTVRQQKQ
ncbi:hypothetical protein Zmor_021028 [Zophobas morio]|uniref:DUF1917 domain-containing protein n=1 Tax=Zophobas morio TaxID=2755281 RepID=A0AA38I554_9CUCU|nr:hypothetical protein Zmor_021028 [Zophobas morio]